MKFQCILIPEIYFGNNSHLELTRLTGRYGRKVLLITGIGSFNNLQQKNAILDAYASHGYKCMRETISGEPSTEQIDSIAEKYRESDVACVVAIGGGSVIDAGKALSVMISVSGSVEQYLEGVGNRMYEGKKIPMVAVSTCSGTGSEVTQNAVISKVGPQGYKRSIRNVSVMPNIAIVDPMLTYSCPPSLTVSSGMDAYTQLLEAYISTNSNRFTDALVLDALHGLPLALKNAFLNSSHEQARIQLAYSAMVSGIGLTNAGLGLVHGFASVIGGYFSIPHGVVCATLLPAVIKKTTLAALREPGRYHVLLQKLAHAGRIFTDKPGESIELACKNLCETLYRMVEDFKIPGLRKYGVTEGDFDKIIASTGHKSHPVAFQAEELREILKERL